ncbi:MAG: tRNA (N(6)-L-threonylcarbamoyladenosine(37)-C(2))-methylthiotransferase MtaB [Propylenella sp.]
MPLTTLTFGCRLNAAESRVMQARAAEAGLADAILVNTCAVTAEAVRQARQAIRKARREHPGRRIIVSGCAAQIEPATFAEMPEVDLVLGNSEKLRAEAYRLLAAPSSTARASAPNSDVVMPGLDPGIHSGTVEGVLGGDGMDCRVKPGNDDNGAAVQRPIPNPQSPIPALALALHEKIRVSDIFAVRENAPQMLDAFAAADASPRVRAFLEVQNGCDHRCTFCIIPYGRGLSRSVPMGAVVDSVRRLAESGLREVVLTGVDLTSYGADLPGSPRLGKLVRAILRHVPELPRLRLSSIDSVEADPELVRAVAEEERLMPHLHLSLQSGDDMILKRMKRRHSRADAIRFADEIRNARPDIVLGADLIAGFPTETAEMFQNTLSLVEACGLSLLHIFPFSPRAGTPAARMPEVPRNMVQERARTLRRAGHSAYLRRLESEAGKPVKILVEQPGRGRTEHYLPAAVDHGAPGDIVSARILGFGDNGLTAQAIREAA